MTPKLCPFCGSTRLEQVQISTPEQFMISCCGCGAKGPPMPDATEAVKAWNGEMIDIRNEQRRKLFGHYKMDYPGDIEKRSYNDPGAGADAFRAYIDDELDMNGEGEAT